VVVSVCTDCNNGWMSRLEEAFKARFAPAIQGQTDTFDEQDLSTLAHWASKTALLLQMQLAGLGEATHIPGGHMRQLPTRTPDNTCVWIGAFAPATRLVFWRGLPMAPVGARLSADSPRMGYLTLLTVGHLAVVVLSLDDVGDPDFETEGLSPSLLTLVWPSPDAPIAWPQGEVIDDLSLKAMWPPRRFAIRSG
jgi:hypothetical protein